MFITCIDQRKRSTRVQTYKLEKNQTRCQCLTKASSPSTLSLATITTLNRDKVWLSRLVRLCLTSSSFGNQPVLSDRHYQASGFILLKLPVRRSSDLVEEERYIHQSRPVVQVNSFRSGQITKHQTPKQLSHTHLTQHGIISLHHSLTHPIYMTTMSPHHQEDDTMSTMSTTSTLVPPTPEQQHQQQRTTLTGRPIQPYSHDTLTNMFCGESFQIGANTLPPGYTDTSLVHIPIKVTEYLGSPKAISSQSQTQAQDLGYDPIKREPRKGSVFSRLSSKLSGSGHGGKDTDGLRVVAMSRGDYLKYWAKGEDGKFLDSVVEPPGGRAEWLASALEWQDREGMPKARPRRTKGTEGGGVALAGIAAMVGNFA
jgi:hypothetical protein